MFTSKTWREGRNLAPCYWTWSEATYTAQTSFKPQRIISKFQSNSLIQYNLSLLLLSRSVLTGNFGKGWQNLVLKTLLSTLCIAPIATDSGCFLFRCNKQKELHMSALKQKGPAKLDTSMWNLLASQICCCQPGFPCIWDLNNRVIRQCGVFSAEQVATS